MTRRSMPGRDYPIAPGRWRVRRVCGVFLTAYGFDAGGIAHGGAWPMPIECTCEECIEQGSREAMS